MHYRSFIIIFSIILATQKSQAIVNGEILNGLDRPEIVRLLLYKGTSGKDLIENGRCTGTAISDFLVLTAGHCVSGADNDKNDAIILHRFMKNGDEETIPASDYYTEYIAEDLQKIKDQQNKNSEVPGCSPGKKPIIQTKTSDLALLKFPRNTFKTWAPVNFAKLLSEKTPIEFLGYGITTSSFVSSMPFTDPLPNDLRSGKNTVWRTSEKRIAIISQYTEPIADRGDSGAPIFSDGEVTAVISTVEEKCESKYGDDYAIMNTATTLSSLEALNFFISAVSMLTR